MRCVLMAVLLLLFLPAVPTLSRADEDAPVDERPFALEPLPVNAEAARRLRGRVTLEQGTFTLPEVAALLEREVGVTVRFDWDGLEEVGVTPGSSVEFEPGDAEAGRMLSMVLLEVAPEGARGGIYPTYMLVDGVVAIGTNRSLVRRLPQVFWPDQEERARPMGKDDVAMLQLERIVTINFEDAALGNVIDYIRDATGVNIVVNWAELEAVGLDRDMLCTVNLSRIPARQLLEAALAQAGADNFDDEKPAYTIAEGVVYISTIAECRNTTAVAIYDIRFIQDWLTRRELRAVYQDDPLAMELLTLDMQTHQGGDVSWQEAIDQVVELVQDTVGEPDEWLDEESTIRELNGNLIIKTTPENHREVQDYLDMFIAHNRRAQVAFVRELEVVRLLRRAEALRADGDHAEALGLVEEALLVDPLHEPARALRLVLEQTLERQE